MIRNAVLVCCLCIAAATPYAQAQNPQPAPPGVVPAPVAPPNSPNPPPEQIAPPGKDVHASNNGQTLSDKLAIQQGTLHPPHDVDPGMTVTPPVQGQASTPVIPPPGSPGGNPHVVPK